MVVVGARWIVGVVEIERDATPATFTRNRQRITSLHGIEQIAPPTVTLHGAGRIAERKEQSTTVEIKPVDRESREFAIDREMDATNRCHGHRLLGTHRRLL